MRRCNACAGLMPDVYERCKYCGGSLDRDRRNERLLVGVMRGTAPWRLARCWRLKTATVRELVVNMAQGMETAYPYHSWRDVRRLRRPLLEALANEHYWAR